MTSSDIEVALRVAVESDLTIEKNISELWLLTIDADTWFATLGYLTQSRDSAPPAIQSTEEFSSLCPGDAVLMKKLLAA